MVTMITLPETEPRHSGLLHFPQRKALNFAGTSDLLESISEIYIFVFYAILGVVRKGVSRGSPWTGL